MSYNVHHAGNVQPLFAPYSAAMSPALGLLLQVCVGDYFLDNTHPIRGRHPAARSIKSLPVTDERSASGLRAARTHRKQASGSVDAGQDQCRRKSGRKKYPGAGLHAKTCSLAARGSRSPYLLDTKSCRRGCGGSPCSLPTSRSCFAAKYRCRLNLTTGPNSGEGLQVATGDARSGSHPAWRRRRTMGWSRLTLRCLASAYGR